MRETEEKTVVDSELVKHLLCYTGLSYKSSN